MCPQKHYKPDSIYTYYGMFNVKRDNHKDWERYRKLFQECIGTNLENKVNFRVDNNTLLRSFGDKIKPILVRSSVTDYSDLSPDCTASMDIYLNLQQISKNAKSGEDLYNTLQEMGCSKLVSILIGYPAIYKDIYDHLPSMCLDSIYQHDLDLITKQINDWFDRYLDLKYYAATEAITMLDENGEFMSINNKLKCSIGRCDFSDIDNRCAIFINEFNLIEIKKIRELPTEDLNCMLRANRLLGFKSRDEINSSANDSDPYWLE